MISMIAMVLTPYQNYLSERVQQSLELSATRLLLEIRA